MQDLLAEAAELVNARMDAVAVDGDGVDWVVAANDDVLPALCSGLDLDPERVLQLAHDQAHNAFEAIIAGAEEDVRPCVTLTMVLVQVLTLGAHHERLRAGREPRA